MKLPYQAAASLPNKPLKTETMWHGSTFGTGIGWGWLIVPLVVITLIWLFYRRSKRMNRRDQNKNNEAG